MYDLIIVGGGPAGASAATFAARAGLSTMVLDEDKGMTRRAMLHNHLGFVEGITGPELVDAGRAMATNAGAEWVEGKATALASAADGASVTAEDGTVYEAKDVLLALGRSPALAEEAGIATRPGTEPRIDSAIDTDADGRTSAPHIWAAGVVGGAMVYVTITAGDGARVALNIIRQAQPGYVDHDVMPAPDK